MVEESPLITVTEAEAGQKLLQFLLRRLTLSQSLLHRWIRTGQVRLNGGRCKAFVRVAQNDIVRIPPFALAMAASAQFSPADVDPANSGASTADDALSRTLQTVALPLPPVVYSNTELLVFNKPAGLPIHAGTGHTDSLAARLAAHYADMPFKPTPVHRLDKDTSGLVIVATSYYMLRMLQDALREKELHKEYVAWVQGHWPHEQPFLIEHTLGKKYIGSDERVRIGLGKVAQCIAQGLRYEPPSPVYPQGRSLLHIRLLTGRTHQIRVQLASLGHPLCGDGKYGQCAGTLLLHAIRLILPDARMFTVLPLWQGADALEVMPPVLKTQLPA